MDLAEYPLSPSHKSIIRGLHLGAKMSTPGRGKNEGERLCMRSRASAGGDSSMAGRATEVVRTIALLLSGNF